MEDKKQVVPHPPMNLRNTKLYRELFNYYHFCLRLRSYMHEASHDLLRDHYSPEAPKLNVEGRTAIVMFDGRTTHFGLADRLRGILSTYMAARKEGVEFKIHFVHPFPLELFLQPAAYDWRAPQLSYNTAEARPWKLLAFMRQRPGMTTMMWRCLRWIMRSLPANSQAHVYTNAAWSLTHGYAAAFAELFKPSELLQNELDRYASHGPYINVATRFLALLGDFNETGAETLPPAKRQALIERTIEQIEEIHKRDPRPVLLTSDSTTFLSQATARLPYTFALEGPITHMDNAEGDQTPAHLRTFVDFMMIARAQHIYLLQGPGMHNSNFARSASLVMGRPFQRLRF